MSDIEKLPKNRPAEIYIDGAPACAGDVSGMHDQGVLLSEVSFPRNRKNGSTSALRPGTRGDLVFLDLFDDEGDRLLVPVNIIASDDDGVTLHFTDQVSELTGTVRRLLGQTDHAVRLTQAAADTAEAFRKRALRQLEKIVRLFIDDAVDHLFDLSSRPSSRDMQDDLYEVMNILKRNRSSVVEAFNTQIDAFFDEPLQPEEKPLNIDDDVSASELDLVDIQDFEDALLIDSLVRKWQSAFALPLEALTIRYAEIVGTELMQTRLPVHIRQLCKAFQQSLSDRKLPATVIPELYSFFSERVLAKLNPFYTGLNVFLRDEGIKPDLDEELEKSGSLLERLKKEKRRQEASAAAKTEPAARPTPPQETTASSAEGAANGANGSAPMRTGPAQASPVIQGAPPAPDAQALQREFAGAMGAAATDQAFAPAPTTADSGAGSYRGDGDSAAGVAGTRFNNVSQLYRSVVDALNFRREHAGGGIGSAVGTTAGTSAPGSRTGTSAPGGRAPASPDRLAVALSALQSNAQVRSKLRDQPSVLQYLSSNQSNIAGLAGTEGFTPECINQLDLVDNLFTDIKSEVDVTADMRPVVGDLQIPLAKLALLEPQFFADRTHPARGVIDRATQLASSGNFPNKPLEDKLTAIIEGIVREYESDSTVFESALDDLEVLSSQQQKALERNIERVVKTHDGQEKLRKAEQAVNKIVSYRVRPPQAPKPIVDLINTGWRDLLKLTFVKQGPNSKAWKDYVKTLDLLSLWLLEQKRGVDDEQVLVERALEAEPLIDMISQQISEALPTNMEHVAVLENLKEVLAGRAELEYVPVEAPAAGETGSAERVRKKVEELPRLRRWVKRAEELEPGHWLSYRDDQGARKRMRLAWVSEDLDRFVFVNERGQKVSELNNIELARRLSRGLKPPAPSEELPLVDQTMYKTLEHVQTSLSFDKNHDDLTRLINRDKFIEQLEQALKHARSKHATHALLYMDIDKFGIVNEVYDKTTGDQVLVEFGKLLAQQHGSKISSARLGEDRFAVLLLDRTLEQSIAHAENIRRDIENSPVNIDGEKISFTVSIGIASIQDHSESVEKIIDNAAGAARDAKQQGANRVCQYNEDKARIDAYKAEETAAIRQIEEALDTKNFVLQAQPIASLSAADGEHRVEHYEILMAIANERGELHSPTEFIANAERFGFMTQVDQWVVRQVFEWVSSLMDEQKTVPSLAINLSGNSVTDDAFMDYLFEQISEYGVGTNKICFEITETGTISNMIKATDFVNEFKNIGCKFSLDDFGTGLASHSYLRELPVDFVKIDGTFVQNIHTNPKDFAMTKSINDLAHFLGQETIAEFAENEHVIRKLREIGVDYVQGWGVGRPEPLKDLSSKLAPLEK